MFLRGPGLAKRASSQPYQLRYDYFAFTTFGPLDLRYTHQLMNIAHQVLKCDGGSVQ